MRDIKAIQKLQKTIDDAIATAERLEKPGTTIAEAMVLLVKNTKAAIEA